MAAFDGSQVSMRTSVPADLLSLEEAKTQVRRLDSEDDAHIGSLVTAVSAYLDDPDGPIGRALVQQTWTFSTWRQACRVDLPVVPVIQVDAIAYLDTDEVEQPLTVSDFHLRTDGDRAFIEPKTGISWPAMASKPDAVRVTYQAGYGTSADVPAEIILAAKLLLAHWYWNPAEVSAPGAPAELPFGVTALIRKHRLGWAAA